MTRERLDKWCEKGILALVLSILISGPLATGAVGPLEFLVIEGLAAVAVLVWMVRIWLNPEHRLLWPPICWAVAAFVVYAILRYWQSDLEYVARQELVRVLVYALVFFVILNNLARQEATQLVSCTLLFLGMAISFYAVYQFLTGSNQVWHLIRPAAYQGRASGTYICPNHLAGMLEMLLPLGLAYALIGRSKPLLRVFLGYASLVILGGIAVTISRGGWLASGVALVLFLALLLRKRGYRLPVLIAVALVTASALAFYNSFPQVQKRVQKMVGNGNPDDVRIRLWLAKPTVQMWLDHLWFGVGPGHFDYRFPAYRPVAVQVRPGHAHNDYLNTLADWGLVGTSLVIACWGLLFIGIRKTWKFVRREPNDLEAKLSNRAAFICGATLGLTAILVHSLVDFNMHIPANATLAVALMAMLSGHLRYATERYWLNPGWKGKTMLTFIGLAVMLYLGEQGWRHARESTWLDRAANENSDSPKKLAAIKKAAEIEPANFETTYSVGEALRQMFWQGTGENEKLATEAIQWFHRGTMLNRYDAYNYLRIGMCLDWLGNHSEASRYFEEAVNREPNSYFVLAHQGWHFVQIDDYATAKLWFERSVKIKPWDNPIAYNYLTIIERKLKETAEPATR